MKGFLLVTLVALATGLTTAVPDCTGEHGTLHENPADCSSYYECDNGIPVLMKCPPGLEWSKEFNRCDFPNVAKCEVTETTTAPVPTTPGPDTTVGPTTPRPTECPEIDDPLHDVLLPNPEDCGTFFKCLNGIPHLIDCPPGQQWSVELSRCDYPEIANCQETATKSTEKPELTTPGVSTPMPTECPEEDDPLHDVLLPNPEDCGSFYKCLDGEPHLIPCPPGQEWSIELSRCDYPEIAQCEKSAYMKGVLSKNKGSLAADSSEEVLLQNKQDCNTVKKCINGYFLYQTNCSSPFKCNSSKYKSGDLIHIFQKRVTRKDDRCPAEDGPEDVLIPNPDDCTTFFKCNNGEPIIQDCPAGLHWNNEEKYCDYPEEAGCQISRNFVERNEYPTECPAENGLYDFFLPNFEDCSTYYKCDNGKKILMDCPVGTLWDAPMYRCDHANVARCASESADVKVLLRKTERSLTEHIPKQEIAYNCSSFYIGCYNDYLVVHTDCTSFDKCTNANYNPENFNRILQKGLTRKDDRCPAKDGPDDVLLLNPDDCTTFFICNNGIPIIFNCPVGLHWNNEGKYCDYPDTAGCQSSESFEEHNEYPTKCPTENGMTDFPNLEDCSKYYKCVNGVQTSMDCPVGTLWDAPMYRCDHANVARCASK